MQKNEFKSEALFTEKSFKRAKEIMKLGEYSVHFTLLLLEQLHIL